MISTKTTRHLAIAAALTASATGALAVPAPSHYPQNSTSVACNAPSRRSEHMLAWLRLAYMSTDYSGWRANTGEPQVAEAEIVVITSDSLCHLAAGALQAFYPGQVTSQPVHLVQLGTRGYAATHDSLRSTGGSLLLVMDTAFAPRFSAHWIDHRAVLKAP